MMGKILRLLLFLLSSFVFNNNIKGAAAAAAPAIAITPQVVEKKYFTIENHREGMIKVTVFYMFPNEGIKPTTTINIPPGGEAELPIKITYVPTPKGTKPNMIYFSHYTIYYKDKDEYSILNVEDDIVGKRLCFTNTDIEPIITSGEATVATTPPAAEPSPIKIEKGNFLIVNNIKDKIKNDILVTINYYDIKMGLKRCIKTVNVRKGSSAKFSTLLPNTIDPLTALSGIDLSQLMCGEYSIFSGNDPKGIAIDYKGFLDYYQGTAKKKSILMVKH